MERKFRGRLRPGTTWSSLSHMTFEIHPLEFVEDCHNAKGLLGVDSLTANAYKLDEFMQVSKLQIVPSSSCWRRCMSYERVHLSWKENSVVR